MILSYELHFFNRSSLRQDVDKTIYGAFVDIDLNHEKISLRSLVCCREREREIALFISVKTIFSWKPRVLLETFSFKTDWKIILKGLVTSEDVILFNGLDSIAKQTFYTQILDSFLCRLTILLLRVLGGKGRLALLPGFIQSWLLIQKHTFMHLTVEIRLWISQHLVLGAWRMLRWFLPIEGGSPTGHLNYEESSTLGLFTTIWCIIFLFLVPFVLPIISVFL